MLLNELSEKILLAVKTEQPVAELLRQLANENPAELNQLASDDHKIAFWVNSYNAWYQILRQRKIDKSRIYRAREIQISQHRFSLDDIEHGILRRFKFKYGGGYIQNPFPRRLIRELAVSSLDWRIHFALNCGAESCPPIAFYSVDRIDDQLNTATASYLHSETVVDDKAMEIQVTKLFQWFAADFGGKAGILQLLAQHLGIETAGYKLVYKPYSWNDQLANFAD